MLKRLALVAIAALTGCLGWQTAAAQDHPITGTRLVLKRSGAREKLVFVSKDPTFLFPPIGSGDDPATGTPGGVAVEIFSHNEGTAALSVPAGAGWRVRDAAADSYAYTNRAAPGGPTPVRNVVLKQGRTLRLVARSTGLPLAGPQGSVGIRISTGNLRNCARFDAAIAQRDEAGRFQATGVTSPAPADCSDVTLRNLACSESPWPECGGACPSGSECTSNQALDGCVCVSSAQPCGDTSPACNGQCPAGEDCLPIGGFPLPGCGCLPAGSTPCSQSNCGGACPTGLECNFFERQFPGASGCECGPPGPCGSGGDDCPAGTRCVVNDPEFGTTCLLDLCSGGSPFPVCDGSCRPGLGCMPIATTEGGVELCACDEPGAACDAGCGGLACPAGEVCTYDPGTQSCSCE